MIYSAHPALAFPRLTRKRQRGSANSDSLQLNESASRPKRSNAILVRRSLEPERDASLTARGRRLIARRSMPEFTLRITISGLIAIASIDDETRVLFPRTGYGQIVSHE